MKTQGMREFAASTYTYLWLSDLRDAIEDVAEAGYTNIEVMAAPPHVMFDDQTDRVAEELRNTCAAAGIQISSVVPSGLDVNLASPDGSMRDWSLRHYIEVGRFAASVGARYLVVHPGRRHSFKPVPYHSGRKLVIEGVSRIIEALQDHKVRPVFENTPSSILDTAVECAEVVGVIGKDALGVCYDVANGFMVEDPADGLRAVGEFLELVHVSDTTAVKWLHAPIGTGEVNFEVVATTIDELNYRGPIVVETIRRSDSQSVGTGLNKDLLALAAAGLDQPQSEASP